MSESLYCVSATVVRYGAARQPFVELRENGRLVARVPAGTFAAMARRGRVRGGLEVYGEITSLLLRIGYLAPSGAEPTLAGIRWAYATLLEARGGADDAETLRSAEFGDFVSRELPVIDEFCRKANLLDTFGGPVREFRAYLGELAAREGICPEHLTRDGVRLNITDPSRVCSVLAPWTVIEALASASPDTDLSGGVTGPELRWALLDFGYLARMHNGSLARFVTPGGRLRAAWLLSWRTDA